MKRVCGLIAAALLCTQAAAQTPRLSLWITDAIGATDARQCALPASHVSVNREALGAKVTQRIDEGDVAHWDSATATWKLRDAGIPARERAWQMADRCFILWIDGRPAAAGVALWSHSARLVSMPVLGIAVAGKTLSLRLGADYASSASQPVAHELIDGVLQVKQ